MANKQIEQIEPSFDKFTIVTKPNAIKIDISEERLDLLSV